ncbi:MAG: class I SAM-dependent methyltransferase [Desulfotignum sp.]|nr:class I SAM-dependent methyltransferase [Desulfotignum sp.]
MYQPKKKMQFKTAVQALEKKKKHPIITGAVDNASPRVVQNILTQAQALKITDYPIDIQAYESYVHNAQYAGRYPAYYSDNFFEKSLEHFLAYMLLDLQKTDVFIDLASEHSPVPEIFFRLTNARTYGQDIMYPAGIHGNRIGGDACNMPVLDGFAHKAALTCSLEHFEEDADTRLFAELYRVLAPGGKVVVVPFYLFTEAAVQTDPTISVPAEVCFDRGSTIYCAEGWGNRHGRFYSPASFVHRIMAPMTGKFSFDVVHLSNAAVVHPSVYARFAFTATRL